MKNNFALFVAAALIIFSFVMSENVASPEVVDLITSQ
jgi:hypothetical protein